MAQQILRYLKCQWWIEMLRESFGRTLSQWIPLEFWNKAMLSSGDNFAFKKQLLCYYRSLVETDHLTIDYQLVTWTAHQELHVVPCSNHKAGCVQLHSVIKQKKYIQGLVQAGPEGTSMLHKPRCALSLYLLHYLLFFNMYLWSHREVHKTSWLRKRNLGLVL